MLSCVEYEKSFITSGPIESRMDVHERIQRVIEGPDLQGNHNVEKRKSCFLTVRPGPPRRKFLDPRMTLHSVLITTV